MRGTFGTQDHTNDELFSAKFHLDRC